MKIYSFLKHYICDFLAKVLQCIYLMKYFKWVGVKNAPRVIFVQCADACLDLWFLVSIYFRTKNSSNNNYS